MKFTNINKCFIILSILLILDCSIGGSIGVWREYFWDSVNKRDLYKFIEYLSYFVFVCGISCFIQGYSGYLSSYAALAIRRKLTRKAFKLSHTHVEAGAQRVQEDCLLYPTLMISLIGGLLRNIIMFIVFAVIVCKQVGWWFLLFPFSYALIGTFIAHIIAKPLIHLNYLNQNFEAKFRQLLSKKNYAIVHRNNYNLFKTTKGLTYFQTFYNQITVIVPYIILAPLYFGLKITFGVFMQVASSMIELINSLSYFINSFNDYNKWLSCRKRLTEIGVI